MLRPTGHITVLLDKLHRWKISRLVTGLDCSVINTAIVYMIEYKELLTDIDSTVDKYKDREYEQQLELELDDDKTLKS